MPDAVSISVGERVFRTYPFSDPDAVPATGERRYPYFRYDGSTDAAVDRDTNDLVTAALELFRNGDFMPRSDEVETALCGRRCADGGGIW